MASKRQKLPPGHRWVVGIHSCFEALSVHPQWVEEVALLTESSFEGGHQKELARFRKKTKVRNRAFFDQLSQVHQGIAVLLSDRPRWSLDPGKNQVVAFLDGLNDPHNLGAIMRTSWLFQVGGLFLPKNRSVGLTPTVSKVACGGVEHVPLEETYFPTQVAELKEEGYWIFGLSEKADKSLFDLKLPEKSAFIVGAEGKGIRSSSEKLCDELVSIPQVSKAASLNASVAFSLAIYEYCRQRS